MIYPNAQNEWYGDGLPEGWVGDCISISGGNIGWGDAMSPDMVLDMNAETVAAHIKAKVLPLLAGRNNVVIVLDLEKPINPGELKSLTVTMARRLAWAIRLRFQVLREMLEERGIEATLLFWMGSMAWQVRPNIDDYAEVGVHGTLKTFGAFDYCDGAACRIFPIVGPDHKLWSRFETVVKNSVEFARSMFGKDAFILPQLSFTTHAQGIDPEAFDQATLDYMASIGLAAAGRCGFWSAKPQPFLTPVVPGSDS